MIKTIIKYAEKLLKKQKLKKNGLSTLIGLQSLILSDHFEPDHISPNGNTIEDYERLIKNASNCSSGIIYNLEEKYNTETGDITERFRVLESNYCNIGCVCSICASRKRNKIRGDIMPYIQTIKKMNEANADYTFYMLTITIKNNSDPGKAYEKLRKSWTNFTKMGQWRKEKRSGGESSKIIASILSVETVPSHEKGKYHCHGHILVICEKELNFITYDQKKKKVLEKKYGKGKVPKDILYPIAIQYLTDKNGSYIHRRETGGKIISNDEARIPTSKIVQEWYISSGANNIKCDIIEEKYVYSRKLKKPIFRTIEDQTLEIIKYEVKHWDFDPLELLKCWDSVQGKRKTTKSGLFTKRKNAVKRWNKLLIEYELVDYFASKMPKEEWIEENEESLTDEIVPMIWNQKTKEYDHYEGRESELPCSSDMNTDIIKESRSLKAKALNVYRSNFSELKKTIGKIPNTVWIENKRELRQSMSFVISLINTELLRKMYKLKKIYIVVDHSQLQVNAFSNVIEEIKEVKAKLYNTTIDNIELYPYTYTGKEWIIEEDKYPDIVNPLVEKIYF